jgi:hypothetical protein
MQFIKSIGNIIGWLKSGNYSSSHVYDYDESDVSSDDESDYLPIRDDSNDIIEEDKLAVFTRSTLYDEQPDEKFINCSCRGEDEDCENHHSTTRTYSSKTYSSKTEEQDIEEVIENKVESLQKIFTNKYLDGIISCLKYLGYYNVNTNKERIETQYKQLSEEIDFSTTKSYETLEELFQKYGIEPDIETINKKVSRAFQLSKYIGTDNWNGFIKDLTKDELDYLLVGF